MQAVRIEDLKIARSHTFYRARIYLCDQTASPFLGDR